MRDRAHFPRPQPEPRREVVEEVPLRLEAKDALEQLVPLLLGVPVHVSLGHRFHRNVRHAPKLAALPQEAKRCAYQYQVLVDRLRPEVLGQRLLERIERRSVDHLYIEVAELRIDPLPDMLVGIPAAVLHARRCHVLGVAVPKDDTPRAREQLLPRAFLPDQSFDLGSVTCLSLSFEARNREVEKP